ncbi:MAG: hypothetical protein U0804_21290 [Gemmataceae bacterium]
MLTALRVTCPTAGDIPPAYQLRTWARDDRLVVLQLPPTALAGPGAKALVVARLAAAMPDYRVSDGGGDRTRELVTVARVTEACGPTR